MPNAATRRSQAQCAAFTTIGCTTRPVGYLEAWYVIESHRQTGVGGALVKAGEEWSSSKGCRELASDTWLDNTTSHRAHLAIGFEETDRLVHYRKSLDD